MRLHFTNRSHLNSAYVNDSGQVMYKVETPNKYFNRVATIKRVLPGDLYSSSEAAGTSSSEDEATNDNDPIAFNPVVPAILRFGGQEHESTQFFTKKAFGWYGSTRAFTGPDGIEYEWILKREVSELVRVDSERDTTRIAQYQRRQLGVFSKPRPASLEIFSKGMHMIDLIVITFVYIQKLRNNKKGSRDR
ncbi:hypothetical protein JOM56_002696 [Amanita muscaria]